MQTARNIIVIFGALLLALLLSGGAAYAVIPADATLMTCTELSAIDGDSIRCDGVNMRDMGDGAPFVSGIDTPEVGSRAKCPAERMMALLAKRRLQELLEQDGVQVWFSGQYDETQSRRPLVWVVLPNGDTTGQTLIEEGYAVEWAPSITADWCNLY